MKKLFVIDAAVSVIVLVIVSICGCGKEKTIAPDISFKTGSGYIYTDTTVVHGTVFNLGINASKTGTESLLTSCTISRSINGGSDSIIQQMIFYQQYFSSTYSYIAGDSGNVERYTFTVRESDGQANSVSITIADI